MPPVASGLEFLQSLMTDQTAENSYGIFKFIQIDGRNWGKGNITLFCNKKEATLKLFWPLSRLFGENSGLPVNISTLQSP